MNDHSRFHIEIHGLAEFACFVALIRGEELDATKLRALADSLQRSTSDLKAASDSVDSKGFPTHHVPHRP